MFKFALEDILNEEDNYYSLVVAVAKRARDIVQDANDNGETIVEKPLSLAIDDFAEERYKISDQ